MSRRPESQLFAARTRVWRPEDRSRRDSRVSVASGRHIRIDGDYSNQVLWCILAVGSAARGVDVEQRQGNTARSGAPASLQLDACASDLERIRGCGRAAEIFLRWQYGEVGWREADGACWIGPSGLLLVPSGLHETTAAQTLVAIGERPEDGYSAVKQLQRLTGLVRISTVDDNIGVDIAGPVTDAQLNVISLLRSRSPQLSFYYDIYDPGTGQIRGSGSRFERFSADATPLLYA